MTEYIIKEGRTYNIRDESLDYDNMFVDHECKLCGYHCKNRRSLGNHLARSHKPWDIKKYVLHFYLDDKVPLCECGCGKEVSWVKTAYKFARYISGHNYRFSSTNQPVLTPEILERRKAATRKVYAERGDEIKAKISESVKKALSKPEWKEAQSQRLRKIWADPEYKARVSESHKKAWRENYDERYKKVFTEEFSRKISLANRNRDKVNKSKREVMFFDIVKEIFPDIIADKWMNYEGGAKCFDAYIPGTRILIEFDGVYWHGIDRDSCFTPSQLISLGNDFKKNRLALASGYSLIRFAMSDEVKEGLHSAKTLDDLIALSRYAQINGEILVDDMFRFSDDKHVLVSRDDLLVWNDVSLGGMGKEKTEKDILPVVVDFFSEYFADESRGWFYPKCNDKIDDVIDSVRRAKHTFENGAIVGSPSVGNTFLKSRMKSFWHAGSGPAVSCHNEKVLTTVLKYRMGLNNSKHYTYALNGMMLSANETFDLSPSTIRKGFIVQRAAVSWFPPVIARDIWKYLLGDKRKPVVWDPSAGFGARMFGFASQYLDGVYVCNEPASMTYGDLLSLKSELMGSRLFHGTIKVLNCGSEIAGQFEEGMFDAVMTSPPYYDKEKYFDEPGQCWRDYGTFESWVEGYLRPTVENAFFSLKVGGKFALNVPSNLHGVVVDVGIWCGFEHVEDLVFSRKRDHFGRKKNIKTPVNEMLVIFSK